MQRALFTGLDRVTAVIACVLVVALLACVALGVLTRAYGAPLIWTDEAARFLMVWLAVFGWLLASRKRIHVRIRYFQGLLPASVQRAVELAFQAALVLFGALIGGYGIALVDRNLDLEATSLPISTAWMYAPMLLAGALTAAQAASEFMHVMRSYGAPPRVAPAGDEAGVE